MASPPASVPDASSAQQIQELVAHLTAEEKILLSHIPSMPAPPGQTSNFENPESIGISLIVTLSILLAIMVIFIANRLYVKLWLVRKLRWDDATLSLAVIGTALQYSVLIWAVTGGPLGKHMWDISVLDLLSRDFTIPAYILTVNAPPTLGLIKSTFFILYLQLFQELPWMRMCSIIGLCFNTVAYVAFTIATFVVNTPRPGQNYVTHDLKGTVRLALPIAVMGIVIDTFILVLPVVAVAGLHASPRKKIGAILVFLSGIMACICSSLTLYYRTQFNINVDITYILVPNCIASTSEMMIGIICACTPSVAYTYRNVEALQGLRARVKAKMLLLLPNSLLATRQPSVSDIESAGIPEHDSRNKKDSSSMTSGEQSLSDVPRIP